MSSDTLRDVLEAAANGLVYSSEVDRPFAFVRIAGANVPVAKLTADAVVAMTDSLGADVTETSLEDLLARHIEQVDAHDRVSQGLIPRYQSLRDTLRRLLGDVRVFRLGQNEVRCVVLGNDPDTGELVGLETVSIES
ncbi:MAG: nuclease A inhibitor family protein [bacterium]